MAAVMGTSPIRLPHPARTGTRILAFLLPASCEGCRGLELLPATKEDEASPTHPSGSMECLPTRKSRRRAAALSFC